MHYLMRLAIPGMPRLQFGFASESRLMFFGAYRPDTSDPSSFVAIESYRKSVIKRPAALVFGWKYDRLPDITRREELGEI